jgi:DNA excision repair protein ERCC-3
MTKPVIVQSDNTLLVEVDSPVFEKARNSISRFSELEKSPEHIHTYRITPLSLWNAAASGLKVADIISSLEIYSKYDIPATVHTTINEQMKRYGMLKLVMRGDDLILISTDSVLINEILYNKKFQNYILERTDQNSLKVKKLFRGHIKQALIKIGFPVEDLAGYEDGDPFKIDIRPQETDGVGVALRDYQTSAVNAFHQGGGPEGGSGVVVLPCGAGKTIVGIGIMSLIKSETLILVTNTVALRQWKDELLNKTMITEDMIGDSGDKKEIKPVTIATYNNLPTGKIKKRALCTSIFSVQRTGGLSFTMKFTFFLHRSSG